MRFAPHATSLTLLLLLSALAAATVSPSEARKKVLPTGCSMKQIDATDPKLRACYAKQDDDWIKGRSYIHVVTCLNGHRYCCKQIDRVGPGAGAANPTEPSADPGPRRPNGPAATQRPTTVSPN